MTHRFIVIDLETTHREPEHAHIVEWAAIVMEPGFFAPDSRLAHGGLVKPPIPIPCETSAVHHIIDADVRDALPWDRVQTDVIDLFQDDPEVIAVAHNANFERTVLAPLNLKCRWLCSYKAAVRVWPEAPGFSNECLRYYLGLSSGRGANQMPHSAMHDAEVTARILEELLKTGTSPEDMIRWTDEPALLPRCPLGDWRGYTWPEVDEGFLLWILRKIHDREDVRFCAQNELDRRRAAEQSQRPSSSPAAAMADGDDDDERPF